MNGSERVRRLLYLVDQPNFKTTLDVGNFLSVDENPVVAVAANAPYASIVHNRLHPSGSQTVPLH